MFTQPVTGALKRRFIYIATACGVLAGMSIGFVASFDVKRELGTVCRDAPSFKPGATEAEVLAVASETALRFVNHAVLRQNEECAFALAGPALRQGDTDRAQWRDGKISVVPFVTSSPSSAMAGVELATQLQSTVRQTEDGKVELPLYVGLAAPDAGQQVFLMVLTLVEGGWRVTGFQPAGFIGAPQS